MRRQPRTAGELRQDFGAFFLWKCVEFLDQFSRTVSHATSDSRWGDLVKESGLEPCSEKARRYEHEEAEAHSRFHTHVANRAVGLQPPLTTIGVQSFNAMRTARLALGIVAVGFFAAWALVDRRVELPPVDPGVEQICGETMRRTPADLSWVAPDREMRVRGREIKTVTLDELPSHAGSVVRVPGVLHAEFEWVALYPSRAAMEEQSSRAPWVTLGSLWADEPFWKTKGPSISDRCVVIEGTYAGGKSGHFGMFNGTIGDVLRLDVWSSPHRPFVPPPPPPVPVDPPCSEKPAIPKPMSEGAAMQQMLTQFNKLYETGEFQLGYCVAHVTVNEQGTVDSVRVLRPQNVDKRVESAIVRSMKPRRYKPATACGRPVAFTMSVGVGHCPSRTERGRKPDVNK